MKFTAKRLLGAGVVGVAAIVAPISLTIGLPALSSGPGSAAFAASGACTPNATYDEICYVQSTSSPPDTYQYEPAIGSTESAETQPATISGTCASPTAGVPAILNVCGFVYSSSTYAAGTSKPAKLGTNGTATGVDAVSPAWTIDNKATGSKEQAEAIDFSPGPNAVVSNRLFSDAQIQIQRKDSGVAQNPSVTVQLAELDSSGTVLATQDCTIVGGTGTQITADTDAPGTGGNCAPSLPATGGFVPTPSTFGTVEVRDMTVSTSISVVNTSTFTLQNQICGQGTISPTSGSVTATLRDDAASPTDCKTYTSFTSTGSANGTNQDLNFGGGTGNLPLSMTVTWAPEYPQCQPDADAPNPCAPTMVSFDGTNFSDQTYCAPADPTTLSNPTLCTTNKDYSYVTVMVNGSPVTATQITEQWIGNVDCCSWAR